MAKARPSAVQTRFSATKARFFYALRPDAVAAGALAALAARAAAHWGGRAFAAEDIHLTLAFVGMRPLAEKPALEAILAGLPSRFDGSGGILDPTAPARVGDDDPAPTLALSRLGTFGRGVLWIGPPTRHGSSACAPDFPHRLAVDLRERLRAARIDFDDRPLKLHATLVRGAHRFEHAPDAPTPPPTSVEPPILAREWSLALGVSASDPATQRRYRWSSPPPIATGAA